ncbi:LRR domain containing protein [Parasponia andersonii]|uniref:LRR domain containing protein n=1 Tax=Parasponia andersonii TaxID=3476 RepID=A0A2P5DJC8_PARAD|nr:LRR domain containing protein [Parasponia andersonii]
MDRFRLGFSTCPRCTLLNSTIITFPENLPPKCPNNRIFGKIPPAIGSLKRMTALSPETNSLYGETPEELFGLGLLSIIDFGHNNLRVEILNSISHCSSLTAVDFSRNSLSGEIPSGIAELKVLYNLKLSRNNFTGQVPGEIRFMKGLTALDLSYNNLSGQVPPQGEFLVFNDESFSGNPHLCPPHGVVLCPSSWSDKAFGSHKLTLAAIIGVATALTIVILPILLTVYRTREEAAPETKALEAHGLQTAAFRGRRRSPMPKGRERDR